MDILIPVTEVMKREHEHFALGMKSGTLIGFCLGLAMGVAATAIFVLYKGY